MNTIHEPKVIRHLYGWGDRSDIQEPELELAAEQLPKLSIVIPTLNQSQTIADTLDSILAQNYANLELVVIDGGSEDHTLAILENYRPWIHTLISEPDRGQSHAINKGFSFTSGDILAWINSDDYYLPGAFNTVVRYFLEYPSTQLIAGAGDIISLDHQFLRHIPALEINPTTMLNWRHGQFVLQQSCFWRRPLWEAAGGVDESLNLLMDYDLWYRFSHLTDSSTIKKRLAVMRYYPDVKTLRQRSRTTEETAYILAKNNQPDTVRELVATLVRDKSEITKKYSHLQSLLPVRLLKRLRMIPKS